MADVFVFYDDVQFVTRNWQSRNRIRTTHGVQWLTVPVHQSRGVLINDVHIANDERWAAKHWASIEFGYSRAPHFRWLAEALGGIYQSRWDKLVDLTVASFQLLVEMVGVGANFLRSSELALPGRGSDRILAYCRELGATRYLSGPAARDYLDEASFAEAGIELEYHRFEHPVYPQLHGPFVPGLSVVDLLANEGPAAGKVLHACGSAIPARDWLEDLNH